MSDKKTFAADKKNIKSLVEGDEHMVYTREQTKLHLFGVQSFSVNDVAFHH